MVVIVSLTQASKCLWIMSDDDGLHAVGNGGLPRIVLSHALVSATLVQRNTISMLLPYSLPSERTKSLTDGCGIVCALQYFGIGDR